MTAHAGAGPPGAHQTDSEPPGGVDPDTGQERAAVIQPIAELSHPNCVAFWAATFTIDLSLFNEYLLGRLGDAPLNAVVLADRDRLPTCQAGVRHPGATGFHLVGRNRTHVRDQQQDSPRS